MARTKKKTPAAGPDAEQQRLNAAQAGTAPRKQWGPYLSEHQWGNDVTLFAVARELADRLVRIFLRDAQDRRPVYGNAARFQEDPHWRDCLLFYEYFHGDHGAGLGASHQTGWTGVVARLIQLFGGLQPEHVLADSPSILARRISQSGA